jgi:hypothetical protein
MPTKRRVMIFLAVLSVMLFAKYMWGQDANESVGWADQASFQDSSIEDAILMVMICVPIFGALVGMVKVFHRNLAARSGALFTSEMVRLRL